MRPLALALATLLALVPLSMAPSAAAADRVPHCYTPTDPSVCLGGYANGPECDTPDHHSFREEGVYMWDVPTFETRLVGWQKCQNRQEPYDDNEAYRWRDYGVKSHTVAWHAGTTVGVFIEWRAYEYESASRQESTCTVLVRVVVSGVTDQWNWLPCPADQRPPNTGWNTLP